MKKQIMLALAIAVATVVKAQTISWNDNYSPVPDPSGVAGVVAATNWNNSATGISLFDNTGAASGASFTISGSYGAWRSNPTTPGQDADSTYNRNMLNGYANTAAGIGPEVFTITGIPYSFYNLYVYISSDTAGRTGTIGDTASGVTYDFTTEGPAAISGANALFAQSTSTTGLNPTANYVIFSNVSATSETLTLSIPVGGGISGFQIVAVPEPGTLALACLSGFALLAWRRDAKM